MPTSHHIAHSISIDHLKRLRGLPEIRLDESPLIAITGANGEGKSTILHALACSYRPSDGSQRTNYKFPHFFLPTSDSRWQGSSFELKYSFRVGSEESTGNVQRYGKIGDRWTPRYQKRPERHVEFIGIRSCVPRIEEERSTTYLEFQTAAAADDFAQMVRASASRVLNRDYEELSIKRHWTGKTYRGATLEGFTYSALSMGAGEQRVFQILETIFGAPKHALILIDEIDLLLHEDALRRLVDEVHRRADQRSLQVVFTTHRESILARGDKVSVHSIFRRGEQTLSMPGAHPDVLHRLTGIPVRTLEIFVEDDVSAAIVARQATLQGVRRHVSITPVGAAANLVTLASGFALQDGLTVNQLFVMDGDVFRSSAEKEVAVKRVLTGSGQNDQKRRQAVLNSFTDFQLAEGDWPERALHRMLVGTSEADDADTVELVRLAKNISVPAQRHGFVDQLVADLGDARGVGVEKIVAVASRTQEWRQMTDTLSRWISERTNALLLA